jgi:hypothetical protein
MNYTSTEGRVDEWMPQVYYTIEDSWFTNIDCKLLVDAGIVIDDIRYNVAPGTNAVGEPPKTKEMVLAEAVEPLPVCILS